MKQRWSLWTVEDEAKLRELAGLGANIRTIALTLRRTESSIKTRARAIGITLKPAPRSRFRIDELAKA
jgi:hypothetical protein